MGTLLKVRSQISQEERRGVPKEELLVSYIQNCGLFVRRKHKTVSLGVMSALLMLHMVKVLPWRADGVNGRKGLKVGEKRKRQKGKEDKRNMQERSERL